MNNIEFLVSGLKIVHPVNVLETGAGLVKLYMKVTKRLYNKYRSGHVSFFSVCLAFIWHFLFLETCCGCPCASIVTAGSNTIKVSTPR